jgi:hypothetical protein
MRKFPKSQNVDSMKSRWSKILKCQYSSGSFDQRGCVPPNPRDHDFATQRFEYGAQREFAKREIVMHLKVGPTVTSRGRMRRGAVQKAEAPE